MNRPRDRQSAKGLLPRMEARPWKDGKTVAYRYHPVGGPPINLGTDKEAALRRVLDMLGSSAPAGPQVGTIRRLWEQYQDSPAWRDLRPRTQADYTSYSVPLLRVFGAVQAAAITAPDVARYLRRERADAGVRANREVSLLGNLIGLAIERGEAAHNPCRGGQVRRNRERPRTTVPEEADLQALDAHARAKGGQWLIVVLAARFAALAGSRQAEFLRLHWPQWDNEGVRLRRAKQRQGVELVERVESSPALAALRAELQTLAREPKLGAVFPNRHGNPYTSAGFAAMWGKLMREVIAAGVVQRRFTFHDLRAFYATSHDAEHGRLPDLHASPTTTATVYRRRKVAARKAL